MRVVLTVVCGALILSGCEHSVGETTKCTEHLTDCTGAPGQRIEYDIDARGRPVRAEYFEETGTVPYFCIRNRYDAAGRLVKVRFGHLCNDTEGGSEVEYGAHNRVTYWREWTGSGVCVETHFTWTELSPQEAEALGPWDDHYDGSRDSFREIHLEFDATGRVVRSSGTLSDCNTYEYDSLGARTLVGFDDDCDGVPERCIDYVYDGAGGLLEVTDRPTCGATAQSCRTFEGDCPDVDSAIDVFVLPY